MLIQHCLVRTVCSVVVSLAGFVLTFSALTISTSAQSIVRQAPPTPSSAFADAIDDPPINIPWSAKLDSLNDVVAAFTNARIQENALLGTSLPSITLPAAAEWKEMSRSQRALWLINEARRARGLAPLQGLEKNVSDVAQGYAEWLLANNAFAHDADGRSPWDRLAENATIDACQDFLPIAENLYFQATTSPDKMPFVIEQAVYTMLYDDADSQWGHRHTLLWTPYTENSGEPDREGFVGIGYAHGSFTAPSNGTFYQNADMIVMDFFDPCSTWGEIAPEPIPNPVLPQTRTLSGRITTPVVTDPLQADLQTEVASNAVNQDRYGLAGVTITSEDGHTTVSDQDGYFILGGLSPQSHTLTPSKEGYTFSPESIEADLSTGDLDGFTLVGAADLSATVHSFAVHLPLISPEH